MLPEQIEIRNKKEIELDSVSRVRISAKVTLLSYIFEAESHIQRAQEYNNTAVGIEQTIP